jgi:hypothetical protein
MNFTRHWHFFRHFLHDASPAYTPEELERYIEAWSQPGASTGMINYYRSSVRQNQKKAEAALRRPGRRTPIAARRRRGAAMNGDADQVVPHAAQPRDLPAPAAAR